MSTREYHQEGAGSLADKIQEINGIKAERCYQCGKCTAGCPMADEMDTPPSLILRLLQTGLPEDEERILRSFSIWLCLCCEICIARCPMEVDIPILMDFLRQESRHRKLVNPKAKDIISFQLAFLDSIKRTGRLYEIGLIADYKFRSWHLLQDIRLAPKMYFKGKLSIFPELIKNRLLLKKLFKQTLKKEKDK